MSGPPQKPIFAIALQYDGDGAPRVTAKGGGELAEQILQLARDNDVPLEEDPRLTAALARVDLGEQIPPALYLAVAEVLAFAYLIAGKAPPAPQPRPLEEEPRGVVIEGTPIRMPEPPDEGEFV